MAKLGLVMAITFCLAGCAGVTHLPDGGDKDHGIRYYRTAPYLLVHSDTRGGLVTKLLYLPDQTQVMSATPKSRLASIKTSLEFQDGVLTSASEEPDSTVMPGAILSAAETVLSLLAARMEPGDKVPQPSLYKITVHGDRITFVGGEGDAPIRVRLTVAPRVDDAGGAVP